MSDRFTAFCLRAFYAMAALSFFYVSFAALYWNRSDPLAITVAAACGILLLLGLYRLSRSRAFTALAEDPRRRRIAVTLLSLVFLALCLFSALCQLEDFTGTDWDLWIIHAEAQNIAVSPFPDRMLYAEYFFRFPLNQELLALFTGWYRLWWLIGGDGVDFNLAAAVFCVLCLWAAHLLFYHTARLWLGNSRALLAMLVWVLFPPFYGYASIPYSDSISLPFGMALFFCLTKLCKTKQPLWGAAAGLAAGMSFFLKGTFAVLLVAAALWLLFQPLGSRLRKTACIAGFAACLAGFITLFPIFFSQSGIWGVFDRKAQKDYWQVPVTHYLMMAQNANGPWVEKDYEFTYGLQGTYPLDWRNRVCMEVFWERVSSRDLLTNIGFTNRKVVETWKDGTYQVNQYERDTYYHPDSPVLSFFRPGTRAYTVFSYASNGLHFAFLLLTAAGMFRRLLSRQRLAADGLFYCQLCLFGMFLLELVWEWRSRYLFGYIPYLILAAVASLEALHALAARTKRPDLKSPA